MVCFQPITFQFLDVLDRDLKIYFRTSFFTLWRFFGEGYTKSELGKGRGNPRVATNEFFLEYPEKGHFYCIFLLPSVYRL